MICNCEKEFGHRFEHCPMEATTDALVRRELQAEFKLLNRCPEEVCPGFWTSWYYTRMLNKISAVAARDRSGSDGE